MSAPEDAERFAAASDRIVTLPNAISAARLVLVVVFGVLVAQGEHIAAVVILAIAGFSDWADGALARKLDQVSKLGQTLDPIADRLLIFVALLAMGYRDLVPWWLVITVLVREVMLAAVLMGLRRIGRGPFAVTLAGKAGTFLLMVAFPILLLANVNGAIGTAAWIAGWAFMYWGVIVYWVAGLSYVRHGLRILRAPATPSGAAT
ncbi:CDP-alcohol phosphatidyltransferase family protein [Rarobacter faecitabidus]|uniref:CDP-diacylglycerol-phosphatidylglycerol phosphatidyltransferase n=1 Tax=Rarobacter faecitabidus TaxID=13243 RepID=A0A542ZVJ6_RARFA|nr:CDP-alcohol phosphatidyltransferase family protein [Rarobacter faecitabidus]TQL64387.1 CDP-diacylglycerol-phosphatidylglycerol phosphatidyltransferase [Rarobacter faecitabidus]